VGGIFFDYLQGNLNEIFDFVTDVGYSFNDIFHHISRNNFKMDYDDVNKKFQQYRRGRYVEFNLVYDRGTLFGLETDGRIESILMSLPPTCNWKYDWRPSTKSKEAELYKYLKPIDWINL